MKSNIEKEYINSVSLEHRKKFAQFFTPEPIAMLMSEWLLKNNGLKTVLEPAFGLGIFSRCLLQQKTDIVVKGFEIDGVVFERARKEFASLANVSLLLQDYMYNDWDNKYDGIICNPPYFKFHDYDNKNTLKEFEDKLACKLNGFTNLYTLFLLKSIYQLKPNGRCAYVVPSEFLNSDYGQLVKFHLLKTGTLRHIIVFDFKENIFDDVLTTASVILCANDANNGDVRFTNIKSIDNLEYIQQIIEKYPDCCNFSKTYKSSGIDPNIKWKAYYQQQNGERFDNLVHFSNFAKVTRGIATGANDYFTFNLSKAEKFGIDLKYLQPCICHSIDVEGHTFDDSDFDDLKSKQKKIYLLDAVNATDENVLKYLEKGVSDKINEKYLTGSRKPWYALEKREPAPIWVSVFNRSGLRFVRNRTKAINLTTFHCVYPKKDIFADISVDLLFAYLISSTAKIIFEDNAREYANGLQKFEPNDLNKGMMLDLNLLSDKQKQEIERLYIDNLHSRSLGFIESIDDILISRFAL